MTIEEKAKAYDDAKARMSIAYNSNRCTIGFMNEIFPELKESEDERIKKEIVNFICWATDRGSITSEQREKSNSWLAWLEKQGEQPKEATYTHEVETGNGNIKALVTEKIPMDKVEPKFKVGDWITNGKLLVGQVTSFDGEYYRYTCDGLEQPLHVSNAHKWHLWTIQDAKDGDVLINDFHLIFIFKEIKNNMHISHCSIIDRGNDVIVNSMAQREVGDVNLVKCHPATKEQRDLLFQKMKEAGYEWDADKKELSRRVIDEGKAEMDYCFTKMMNGEKVSSAWSEEDEEIMSGLLSFLLINTSDQWAKYGKWLKSLKERIGG